MHFGLPAKMFEIVFFSYLGAGWLKNNQHRPNLLSFAFTSVDVTSAVYTWLAVVAVY